MRDYKLTEEMKQDVAQAIQKINKEGEKQLEMLTYCAMSSLEELRVAERDVDMLYAMRLEKSMQSFKKVQNAEYGTQVLQAVFEGMLADGTFVVPVEKRNEEYLWSALSRDGVEVWLPVFTRMQKVKNWMADSQFWRIPMPDVIMRMTMMQPVNGIVINPNEDNILIPFNVVQELTTGFLNEYTKD